MAEDKKFWLPMVVIVGIVAVVGLFTLLTGVNPGETVAGEARFYRLRSTATEIPSSPEPREPVTPTSWSRTAVGYKTGDVNSDGKIDSTDALMVFSYLNGIVDFDSTQRMKADVNVDGKITHMDALIILQYDVKLITQLPHFASKWGDVDNNGKVDSTDALRIQSFVISKNPNDLKNVANADVNNDGLITNMDAYLVLQYDVGVIGRLPAKPTLYGDVDNNRKVDSTDALRIQSFVSSGNVNVLKNVANADVDLDGDITNADANLVLRFDSRQLDKLPVCPDSQCIFRPGFTTS